MSETTPPSATAASIAAPPADPQVDDRLLRALASAGHLNEPQLAHARTLAGITPTREQWFTFLERLFAIGGAAIASAALVCFIAYNWDALGRWFRFALFEGAVVLFAIGAFVFAKKPLAAKASALLAYFALGGLLAFVGQTYQTGADTYQLFFAWAALGLIWLFAAKWWGLWLVGFFVLQIGLLTWTNTNLFFFLDASSSDSRAYVVIAVSLACFALFYTQRHRDGLESRWLWRIAAAASIAWATMIAITWGRDSQTVILNVIAAAIVLATYWFASRIGHDSFDATLLYVCAFAGIALSTWWLGNLLDSITSAAAEFFLLFAAYIAGAAAFSTVHIKSLMKRHNEASANGALT
jgi:uncharacterized membrane protein